MDYVTPNPPAATVETDCSDIIGTAETAETASAFRPWFGSSTSSATLAATPGATAWGEPAMALCGTSAMIELLSDSGVHPVDISSSLFDQLRRMSNTVLEACDVHWLRAGHAIFSGVKP